MPHKSLLLPLDVRSLQQSFALTEIGLRHALMLWVKHCHLPNLPCAWGRGGGGVIVALAPCIVSDAAVFAPATPRRDTGDTARRRPIRGCRTGDRDGKTTVRDAEREGNGRGEPSSMVRREED
jgi:hypothetical protein